MRAKRHPVDRDGVERAGAVSLGVRAPLDQPRGSAPGRPGGGSGRERLAQRAPPLAQVAVDPREGPPAARRLDLAVGMAGA
jgi:hypothetical protein